MWERTFIPHPKRLKIGEWEKNRKSEKANLCKSKRLLLSLSFQEPAVLQTEEEGRADFSFFFITSPRPPSLPLPHPQSHSPILTSTASFLFLWWSTILGFILVLLLYLHCKTKMADPLKKGKSTLLALPSPPLAFCNMRRYVRRSVDIVFTLFKKALVLTRS